MDDYVIVDIPRKKRLRNALITLIVTLAVTGWAFGYVLVQGQVGMETLWLLPFLLTGLWVSYRYWKTTHLTEPTPEAQERQRTAELEKQRKAEEFENKWYVRYPIAVLILWGAWYIVDKKPDSWWIAALVALAAIYFARELALLLIGIGLIYLLFQGIAALPVSIAIIIGAIIIASALKR